MLSEFVSGHDGFDAATAEATDGKATEVLAYLTCAETAGLLPEEPEPVLAAFELNKALYELGYELRCRPDWVGIPVTGIRRVLDCW